MSTLPKNLRDMATEYVPGSPGADILIRAAQWIEQLVKELDLSQGEVGSLELWVMKLQDRIAELEKDN